MVGAGKSRKQGTLLPGEGRHVRGERTRRRAGPHGREQASRQRGRDDAAEGGEDTVLISPPEERPNGRFVQILLSQKSLSA